MRNGDLFTIPINLYHGVDIDIIKDHQLVAPIAVGVQVWVLLYRLTQAINNKCGEGQSLPCFRFVFFDVIPNFSDIDLDQAVNDMSFPVKMASVQCKAARLSTVAEPRKDAAVPTD